MWGAPYHTQAFAGPFLHTFQARHPILPINVHYDDMYTAVVRPSRVGVVDGVVKAVEDLDNTVREEMGCRIAEHKAQVVASDFGIHAELATALRRLGGDGRLVTASHLGTDFTMRRRIGTAVGMGDSPQQVVEELRAAWAGSAGGGWVGWGW